MTYDTPQALRMALEHRLLTRSEETGIGLDRLRRRVVFERIVVRLEVAEPGQWVLKGGMALEVRMEDAARLTKDIDLGLRDTIADSTELHDRLIEALSVDLGDGFVFAVSPPKPLGEDGSDWITWRSTVAASLAGKQFGTLRLDVSPRAHELYATEHVQLPNSLDFAGITTPIVELIDVHRHAAEKFHAMLRDYGDRENSRVRDLVDLVILIEQELLDSARVAGSARDVWTERDGSEPPVSLPALPESWPSRYEKLAADGDLDTRTFPAAVALVVGLWSDMFPTKEI
ncbi:MAG: nucleotidyl transferase AbiEii/AbiGii toxin family protein [Actinomycetota bacterium]